MDRLRLIIPLILSIWLLSFTTALSQQCECTNCSQPIPTNSTTNITFEVSGALNNNLANAGQGVCGVIIEFRHDFIWSVEMVLISPSGQQISLVGPPVMPPLGSYTGFAYWDISFVPAATAASPDSPFNVIWSNNQNWQTAGQYRGSYYPFSGSLEDFNTGTVDGIWTLEISNTSSFYSGFIDHFQVIFCEDSGLNCFDCAADGGDLSNVPNLSACPGDPILAFSPIPSYPSGAPDPSLYNYEFLISRNDTILSIAATPDLTAYPAGSYEVCGFSYLMEHQNRLPNPPVTKANLQSNFTDPLNPHICGAISLDCIEVMIENGAIYEFNDTICDGSTYSFGGNSYTDAGTYEYTVTTTNQCDSLIRVHLSVNDTSITHLLPTICEGTSYEMGGVNYTLAGHYEANLVGLNGCDSLVVLDLAVSDTVVTNLLPTICEGTSYEMGGVNYTLAGHYEANLVGLNGCDSLVVLDLAVSDTVVTNLLPTICEGTSYEMGGVNYTLAGHYEANLVGLNGCDSLVVLDLAVSDTVVTNLLPTICEGTSYEMGGVNYTLAGHYEANLVGLNGCDSLVVLDLAVSDTVVTNLLPTICEGTSYEMGGVNYTLAGHYEANLVGLNGCDSLVVLDLAVSDTVVTNLLPTICEGTSYEMGGVNYTLAGHYEANLVGLNGCDSLVVLDLAVSDTVVTNLLPTICEGTSYEMGGVNYTLAGHYEANLVGLNGCDSLVVLDLAVSDTVVTNLLPTICEGTSYEMGGVNYTLAGHYEANLVGLNGCDSLVVLDLAVSDTVVTNLLPTICEGTSYEMGGVNYTLAGHYEANLVGLNGCDSLVVLDLAVSDTVVTNLLPTICEGTSYEMGGVNYTLAGHYEANLVGLNGCDSLVVLDLAVSDTVVTNLLPTICEGTSYEMGGVNYTLAGHYEANLVGLNGCDSLVVLDLMVSDTVVTNLLPTICEGTSYEMGGVQYSVAGHYESNLTSVLGCDSLVVLDLMVSDTVVTNLLPTICEGTSYEMGGVNYTLAGHYEANLVGLNGCDSLVVLDLMVSDTVVTNLLPTICEGTSYEMGGVNYTLAGHYEANFVGMNGCDSLVVLDLMVSDTVVTNLLPTICEGTSYEMGGVQYSVAGHYESNLTSVLGCDSLVVLDLTVSDTILTNLTPTICEGASYEMGGVQYSVAGHYESNLTSVLGCDSLVVLDLTVSDTILTNLTPTICEGASYEMGGVQYSVAGHYESNLTSVLGCDSLVVLDLTVSDTILTNLTPTICEGASYEMGGVQYSVAGHYESNLTSVLGCDSLVVLDLMVSDTILTNLTPTICEGASYEMGGVQYSVAGHYESNLTSVLGCDSLVVLDLTVSDTVVTNLLPTICEGASYEMGGVQYSVAGHYESNLTSVLGCDSLVVLDLAVGDTVVTNLLPTICEGTSYEMGGVQYSVAGHYESNLTSVLGCDSLVVLDLMVSDTILTNLTPTICEGASYEMGGVQYSVAGHYESNLTSVLGCDSLVVLDLMVSDTILTNLTPTICEGASYEMGGVQYSVAGHYESNLTSVLGCDSLVALDLTVSDTILTNLTPTICEGASYEMGGVQYSVAGHYESNLTSVLGCDSLVVLDLMVSDTVVTNLLPTICEGTSYEMGGVQYTIAGHYEANLVGVNGCDSLVVLDLTVSDTILTNLTPTICEGASYEMGGVQYSVAGHYESSLTSVLGCDSLVVLDLTVSDTILTNLTPTICEGASYEMGGVLYTIAGHYESNLTSVLGCDSLVVLDLMVSDTILTNLTPTICEGASYEMGGVSYTTSGHYEASLLSAAGCDSIVVLDLLVADTIVTNLSPTICEGASYEMGGASYTSSGHYETSLVSVNGCDSVVVLDLSIIAIQLTISSPDTLNCSIDEVRLEAGVLHNGDDLTYNWVNSNGQPLSDTTFVVTTVPETYVLTVEESTSGCSVSDTVVVQADQTPPTAYAGIIGNQSLNCQENSVLLSANNSTPLGQLNFEWLLNDSILANSIDLEVQTSGSYQLIVENISNGCRDTSFMLVAADTFPPDVSIAAPALLNCRDTIIQLDAMTSSIGPSYSYQWFTEESGTILSGDTTLMPMVNAAGMYTLIITNQDNHCMDSASVLVIADEQKPIASAGQDTLLDCFTDQLFLDGTASSTGSSFSYLWQGPGVVNGDTSLNPLIDQAGTYFLQVIDRRNGCVAIDEVIINGDAVGIHNAVLTSRSPDCVEQGWIAIESVDGGNTPYLYAIDNQPFTGQSLFQALPTGTFQITVQDAAGCEWDTTIVLDEVAPVVLALGADKIIELGDSVLLQPQLNKTVSQLVDIQWFPLEIIPCDSCLRQYISPTHSVVVELIVTDENGCVATDRQLIQVRKDVPVFIPNIFSPNGDGINDELQLFASPAVNKISTFKIFDRFGETVFEAQNFLPNDPSASWDGRFRGEAMNPQVFVYFAEVELIDGSKRLYKGDITLVK